MCWENTLLRPAGVPKRWIRCALGTDRQDLEGENGTADIQPTPCSWLIWSYASVAAREAAKTKRIGPMGDC